MPSFSVTMQPPYLLVLSAQSAYNLSPSNNVCAFGQVVQVNASTSGISVGDIVYYNNIDIPIFYSSDDSQYYNVVDESKVFFIEVTPP